MHALGMYPGTCQSHRDNIFDIYNDKKFDSALRSCQDGFKAGDVRQCAPHCEALAAMIDIACKLTNTAARLFVRLPLGRLVVVVCVGIRSARPAERRPT
eukprot:6690005-Prymnesium_polylepis.1